MRSKAIKLRRKGLSYGEIKRKTGIAKSTLSYWLKIVPLTPAQRKHFYSKRILNLSLGPESQKERRIKEIAKIISEAEKEIAPLSFETYRLVGAF